MVSNHKYLIDPSPTSWTETEWCCLANALASSSFMEVTRKGFKILTRHCLWCVYPSSVYLTSPHMTSSPSLCICMPQVIENGSWEWPTNEATNMQSQLHSHATTWGNPPHLYSCALTSELYTHYKQGSHSNNKLTKSITTNPTTDCWTLTFLLPQNSVVLDTTFSHHISLILHDVNFVIKDKINMMRK